MCRKCVDDFSTPNHYRILIPKKAIGLYHKKILKTTKSRFAKKFQNYNMYLNNSKKTPFSKLKIFKDVWKSGILV